MINNIKIKNEMIYFNYEGSNVSILNTIRRRLLKGDGVWKMNIKTLKTNQSSIIKKDGLQLIFKKIYINHEELKSKFNIVKIPKITFILNVKNVKSEPIWIKSDDIIFYYENKKIKNDLIKKNIPLFILDAGYNTQIKGNLIKKNNKLVGLFAYKKHPDLKDMYFGHTNILEIYSPFTMWCSVIADIYKTLDEYKKLFDGVDNKADFISHNINHQDGKTILVLLSSYLHNKYKDIYVGYKQINHMIDEYVFDAHHKGGNIKNMIVISLDELMKIYHDIYAYVSRELKNYKKIIRDY